MIDSEHTVIFLSGAWPGYSRGYSIANLSTLDYFSSRAGKCIYIGPDDETLDPSIRDRYNDVDFCPVNIRRKPKSIRFFKSLFSSNPAITERFWKSERQIISIIKEHCSSSEKKITFFYEDLPAAYLMSQLKKQFPSSLHIVRSHNVVYKGFEGLTRSSHWLMNQIWKIEVKKIGVFEREVCQHSDRFYAISEDDAAYYEQQMGLSPDGVIGFYIEFDKYRAEGEGEENVIYLGSADLRKGQALAGFITEAWPIVREKRPECKLILGGMGTKRFHDPVNGVIGLGFVESEAEFMNKGSIFINPQQVGAGVKIKSLIALANKKLLVSTRVGAEGTGLKKNIHCIVEDEFPRQAEWIIQYLDDKKSRNNIIEQGKSYILEHFSKEKFFASMDIYFK